MNKIIISLTSYPSRIRYVSKAIKSLLNQSRSADMVVLWLGEKEFPNKEADLPEKLLELRNNGLIILWTKDIGPFTKLIPSLSKFPEDIIVTADDDVLYSYNWLERLLSAYEAKPEMIHCHRCHQIVMQNDSLSPYSKWNGEISAVSASYTNFLTGVGGVLYPPRCFFQDVLKEEIFMKLTPSNDDIWFWIMAVLNNTKINVINNNIVNLKYVTFSQRGNALTKINNDLNQNDVQLHNIIKYYPQILLKLNNAIKKKECDGFDIPILFCVWSRPDLTNTVFQQIRKIKPKKLYISADGPRNDYERNLCKETQEVIKVDWDCEVKTLYRGQNVGCKYAMSGGISWFFEHEEMGIILEDDCFPDLSFFQFCKELLLKYKDDSRVMHIAGRGNVDLKGLKNEGYSYYFGSFMSCWGWASWRRAWRFLDLELDSIPKFIKEDAISKYIVDTKAKNKYRNIYYDLYKNKPNNTWAWPYSYSLLCQNALCINPLKNLIKNIGVNSEQSANYQAEKIDNNLVPMKFPLKHPLFIGKEGDMSFGVSKNSSKHISYPSFLVNFSCFCVSKLKIIYRVGRKYVNRNYASRE